MGNETITASFDNKTYHFEALNRGVKFENNQKIVLSNPDWMPMLVEKGFAPMIDDWLKVVNATSV